jgi:hypothetical protein
MYGRYERSARWTLLPVFALVVGLAAPAPAAHAAKAVGDGCEEPDVKAAKARTTQVVADEESEKCGPLAPGEWKVRQDLSGGAALPEHAVLNAAGQARRMPSAGHWTSEGPTDIGGRVTGIAVDPKGAVFLTAASGGVWKSTDQAKTFTSVWPDRFPQATGATAATPDGTIYVGTGEANPGGRSITYEGDGVYRTTDGGAHWQRLENVTKLTPGDTTGLKPDASFSRGGVAAAPGGMEAPSPR